MGFFGDYFGECFDEPQVQAPSTFLPVITDAIQYTTFASFADKVRKVAFPESIGERVLFSHSNFTNNALIKAQKFVDCLRTMQVSVFSDEHVTAHCGVGRIAVPRGKINAVYVISPGEHCRKLFHDHVTPDAISCWVEQNRCKWEKPDTTWFKSGSALCADEDDSDAITCYRNGPRLFGVSRERMMYLAPRPPCGYLIIVHWEGIRRRWGSNDIIPDDQELIDWVAIATQAEVALRSDRDPQRHRSLKAKVNSKFADLMWWCTEERRIQARRECVEGLDSGSLVDMFQPIYEPSCVPEPEPEEEVVTPPDPPPAEVFPTCDWEWQLVNDFCPNEDSQLVLLDNPEFDLAVAAHCLDNFQDPEGGILPEPTDYYFNRKSYRTTAIGPFDEPKKITVSADAEWFLLDQSDLYRAEMAVILSIRNAATSATIQTVSRSRATTAAGSGFEYGLAPIFMEYEIPVGITVRVDLFMEVVEPITSFEDVNNMEQPVSYARCIGKIACDVDWEPAEAISPDAVTVEAYEDFASYSVGQSGVMNGGTGWDEAWVLAGYDYPGTIMQDLMDHPAGSDITTLKGYLMDGNYIVL